MSLSQYPDFDNHEYVCFHKDSKSGLMAIIAIHNTNLGPSLGGCRMFPYDSERDALTDVLRLSKGMTYKAALASLPMGGGKSVIIGDPRQAKPAEMMQAMGRFVDKLGGAYIVAEDSGIAVSDVIEMSKHTLHVGGVCSNHHFDGRSSDGNPAPATAFGVYTGIRSAVKFKLGTDLTGISVAISGLGHVGMRLAEHLNDAGAKLIVSDVHEPSVRFAQEKFGAIACSVESMHSVNADVFAPCALGNAINQANVETLNVQIIAGAANNQLEHEQIGYRLMERGILYAPDYAMNAGGIIDIYHQKQNSPAAVIKAHLESVGETLTAIFTRSESEKAPTHAIADKLAEEKFLSI